MAENYTDFVQVLVDAIHKRDFVHRKVTNSVAKRIDFVFEAIIEYLNENALDIEWEGIEISNELLVISASIPTKGHAQRMLSVGIPFEVIQHQTKEKVMEFFAATEKERMSQFHTDNDDDEDFSVDSFDEHDDNVTSTKSPIVHKRVLH